MNIHNYFIKSTSQVTTTQINIPQDYKQQCIKEIYRLGDSMNHRTNVKAIMTSFHIWEESKVFNTLLNNIKLVINNYIDGSHKFKYTLKEAWGAIYKKGDYTVPHQHLPHDLSFVYYLQSSGKTPMVFDGSDFKVYSVDDMLAIFPAYLTHSVPKHNDEEDRVCIAGNLQLYSHT